MCAVQLTRLVISLIGFNAIFVALLQTAVPAGVLIEVLRRPWFRGADFEHVLMMFPAFLIPLLLGVALVRNSGKLADWLIQKVKLNPESPTVSLGFEETTTAAFSLLGIYMLFISIPTALETWIGWNLVPTTDMDRFGREISKSTLEVMLPHIVTSVFSISFALFVFFRANSFAKLVNFLRKAS